MRYRKICVRCNSTTNIQGTSMFTWKNILFRKICLGKKLDGECTEAGSDHVEIAIKVGSGH